MKLIMLGTGNAVVTECYNTCFILENNGDYLLVDGGGGNGILQQLKKAGIDRNQIHHIFVTHKHVDHLLGVIWMLRVITQAMAQGKYAGDCYIYGHDEVIGLIQSISSALLKAKFVSFIGSRVHLVTLGDGDTFTVLGNTCTAFDIQSTKAKQFGFTMTYDGGKRLTCCGDEPYSDCERAYAEGADWLLHEAFCLSTEADVFHPYEKHHSTVADACQKAEELGVKNLILYHTEDKNITRRRELYTAEGVEYFKDNLYVPEDLDSFTL